jgi:glutamate N-acetyltransferase/amino-acid N-acetyltransferase
MKLAQGFLFAGLHCGIKPYNKKDIGIIYSKNSNTYCTAVFTKNKVKSESILVSQANLRKTDNIQAIVVISGIANTLTGKLGRTHAQRIISLTAKYLNLHENQVLIASTGKIGKYFKMENIEKGIKECVEKLSATEAGLIDFSQAILTTDTTNKISGINFKDFPAIIGIAKGAGMICPDLATMLCFILTDACIDKKYLRRIFKTAINKSFNRITVDGCMSTNDMVVILSNPVIKVEKKDLSRYKQSLETVCCDLAKKIVKDAEGATKCLKLRIKSSKTFKQAKSMAYQLANSVLFKSALFGNYINIGRVIQALGSTGYRINLDKLKIYLDNQLIYNNYKALDLEFSSSQKELSLVIDLQDGTKSHEILTCDLSPEYIKFNSRL